MTPWITRKRLAALVLTVIAMAAVAAAVLVPRGLHLQAGAAAYVEAAVPQLVAHWTPDALQQRAAPELLQQTDRQQLAALFAWFSTLGELIHMDTPVGHIGRGTYPGTTFSGTWADYVTHAQFDAGTAQIKTVLRRHDGRWQIIGFHITSAALLPASTPTAAATRHACAPHLQVDGQAHALTAVHVFDGPPALARALAPEIDTEGRAHWAFTPGQDTFHLQCRYGAGQPWQVIAATGATRCQRLPARAGIALQGLCE